ncbi:hypothetical protein M501DRAFT_721909 [Patellaria atrata CBS 101060]|uniref:ERT1/acuK family PAS domain-containing protein n=1 Tax=Patellaria atrata CBS 101060 TaxID=1346257 RepID=A0A9P4VQ99_9PEZI|nr:hypothetical protein M501DRAFT_721909 [Patellaria atrata CBS 101060]
MTCDLERPCTRCIKRDIGHLCHDEPRDPSKKSKSEHGQDGKEEALSRGAPTSPETALGPVEQVLNQQDAGLHLGPPPLPQNRPPNAVPIAQPSSVSAPHIPSLTNNNQSYLNFGNDWNLGSNSQFQDMQSFHPSYMFNASEVTNEYNLLNDFLSNSLLDEGTLLGGEDIHGLFSDPSLTSNLGTASGSNAMINADQPHNQFIHPSQAAGNAIPRPGSALPLDKAREKYYMTAADPAGTDTPEERMNKLLKAKYDAGLLKPFNYVKGYARLNQYMEQNMSPTSRNLILRQLDKFRPKFRERMHSLTDIELILVEFWFEKRLMEYDRVFASMAIPACCWRRTGEIFRGNKEMAELIHVPMERLRDGNISLHEIMVQDSLVSYWQKFGAIAFDSSQKAILTSCSLKNPGRNSKDPEIKCCFSFTIRRDNHNIPSLIVGNFLPQLPPSH